MREVIEAHFANPETLAQGQRELREFLLAEPTLKNYQFAHRLLENHVYNAARQTRVALLTSYTVDFVIPLLKTELGLSDIEATVYKPHFNQFRQEILNPASGLYQFNPDLAIVGFNLEEVFPDAMSRFPALSAVERNTLKGEILQLYSTLANTFRQNAGSRPQLLLQNLIPPFDAYDPLVRDESAIQTFIEGVNAELQKGGHHILDYSRLVGECGARTWTDPRTCYTARIPVAQNHWLDFARCYASYIRAALNAEVKCIVLDLDNTLWGGVLGEDGFDGIRIGDTYPGIAFKRFQEYLLALHANGYILAISSKNDSADVMDVLRRHPRMVLREEHFAAIEANWNSKAESIREISNQIQISFDHMLFVDDNPVEIAKVRAAIPAVACLQISSPPLDFARRFEAERCLGKLLVTDEDRRRGKQYSEDRQRRQFRQSAESTGSTGSTGSAGSAGSIVDFYRGLKQRLTVYVNHQQHIARIVQLTQRTNQFNMTTIRLTEQDVAQMMSRPEYMLFTADLADEFGDSGTIAFVQIRKIPRAWVIENWLMSCRVLGRTVEERMLNEISDRAKREGVETLFSTYVPSRKNAPFADFYIRNGFVEADAGENGQLRFAVRPGDWRHRETFVEIIQGSGQAA